MSYATSEDTSELLTSFQSLSVDKQLALFYFIYKEMGGAVTPAAPGASTASPAIAEALFDQVKAMSREEQLQIQRDLIQGTNTEITREYASLSDTTKLLFWYLLAQGMDNGSVIPMPETYSLSDSEEELLNQVKAMDYQKQMTFFRDLVSPMGSSAEPKLGEI
ncbi:MAG: orange carotenoid protein N-terminal domain-containing protein [Geitlerinemataceae cyanobacterium]